MPLQWMPLECSALECSAPQIDPSYAALWYGAAAASLVALLPLEAARLQGLLSRATVLWMTKFVLAGHERRAGVEKAVGRRFDPRRGLPGVVLPSAVAQGLEGIAAQ